MEPELKQTENAIEAGAEGVLAAFDASADMRQVFFNWLSAGDSKEYPPSVAVSCMNRVSEYAIRKKICQTDFWSITQHAVFMPIYTRILDIKLLQRLERSTYKTFVVVGQLYLEFLRIKSTGHIPMMVSSTEEASEETTPHLSIREAAVRVLETSSNGMTSEQIYNRIVADGLYNFGAQNPLNVVRVQMDRACEGSNYSIRTPKDIFRFERNANAEKVYFLLKVSQGENADKVREARNEPSTFTNIPLASPVFWSAIISRGFQIWLQSEGYSSETVCVYNSAVVRAVADFPALVKEAEKCADSTEAAVHKYIKLLNEDERFRFVNRTAHNQPTAALAALKRFFSSEAKNNVFVRPMSQKEPTVSIDIKATVVSILEERFPNGIRPNSVIDTNKLKAYYNEITGEELTTDVTSLLNTIGIRNGAKVFAVPTNGKSGLADLLDRLLSENNRLFYYDEFYNIHAGLLQSMNIFSSELLKRVLVDLRPSLCFSKAFFATDSDIVAASEVLRCYENNVCLSFEQFKERLPYVPLDKIRQILAQNSDFIWVNTGVYTHICKLELDERDRRAASAKVDEEIANRGYASLAFLDVSESLGLNPELSETAVKNGLFQVCLADRYEKRGNIITVKGTVLNSVAVFEDFCLSNNCLTLGELLDFEKEINGTVHSQILYVAYNTIIRTDKDTFVGDSEIDFDVKTIDNALARFVHTDVIPLRAVTSFTSFPYIDGYPWNWFLLESYCRRFSKRYMFQCLSVSSRNVGAIFPKSAGFTDYTAVLAAAVADADVRLNSKDVGDFLFESGYIARRTNVIHDVITQARILREKRA